MTFTDLCIQVISVVFEQLIVRVKEFPKPVLQFIHSISQSGESKENLIREYIVKMFLARGFDYINKS